MDFSKSDIDPNLEQDPPPDPVAHAARMKDRITDQITFLRSFAPTREMACAITKLQEAQFWLDEDIRCRIYAENQKGPCVN